MPSFMDFEAAELADQPDPDWDAGELDFGAERPPPPPSDTREQPWIRVGFGIGTTLAVVELLVLLVAPAADTGELAQVADAVEDAQSAGGTLVEEATPLTPARPLPPPELEQAMVLAAQPALRTIHRAPPPPSFGEVARAVSEAVATEPVAAAEPAASAKPVRRQPTQTVEPATVEPATVEPATVEPAKVEPATTLGLADLPALDGETSSGPLAYDELPE